MKLQEFKKAITDRLFILRTNIWYSIQEDFSSFFNNIGNVFSTVFFTLTYLVFIKVIFSNINVLAGYSKDEILLLTMIGQFHLTSIWLWSYPNLEMMTEHVYRGTLDLLLLKPFPALFYICTRRIDLINTLKDGIPTMIIVAFNINWESLQISNIPIAILIFLLAEFAFHCFNFIVHVSVFWIGVSYQIGGLVFAFDDGNKIPLEGYNKSLRFILTVIVPALVSTQVTTSVLLGKSDPIKMLGLVFMVSILFFILKMKVWRAALKVYSGSS